MKITSILLLAVCLAPGCSTRNSVPETRDYTLVDDEGIYVEQFDSTNVAENRYTANNLTYLEGNRLVYDYYYQDTQGNRYKFEELANASELNFPDRVKAWTFIRLDSLTERTIDKVELTVTYGLSPMDRNNPDYNQTVINYQYPQVNGERNFNSHTGVIENERNVWTHPPRDRFFRILEINPFPFIQAPYEVGHIWEWSLKIGSFWGDERWKAWEGPIVNAYTYEIVDQRKIDTSMGAVKCLVIDASATSAIGTTQLTSYFNPEMGFVKLDYTNIDGTKTVLELVDFDRKRTVDELGANSD